ncbi:hypothetical protein Ocin01_12248 [Orchesella cincta]|uniref:BTB domain-containing protein n=1 Tax=Orchesella cincta TaxID=48709 RepID=A0A1D2MNK7_ORCCI|nr:hypothetical protein Ocin01_12248 [Orchesella cincta]
MQRRSDTAEEIHRTRLSQVSNKFSTRDLECELGKTRIISELDVMYNVEGQNLEWKVFLFINPEGMVELGYTLMHPNPVAPIPSLNFVLTVQGKHNGTGWSSIHIVEGHRLPAFTRVPSYTRMWMASKEPRSRIVDPKISSVEDYIDPVTKSLDFSWNFEVWSLPKLKILTIDANGVRQNCPIFDIRDQVMVSAEFRGREPDLYIIARGGVVKAHLDKLYGECPFVREAVASGVRRRYGCVWIDLGFADYEIMWRLVALLYNCYNHGLEEHLTDMLVMANKLKLRKLYVELLQWVPQQERNGI